MTSDLLAKILALFLYDDWSLPMFCNPGNYISLVVHNAKGFVTPPHLYLRFIACDNILWLHTSTAVNRQ